MQAADNPGGGAAVTARPASHPKTEQEKTPPRRRVPADGVFKEQEQFAMSTAAWPVGRGRALRDLDHPPTRGAGIAFIVATVAAAVLPWPLGLWPVALVAVACLVGLATSYADRARQVAAVAQAAKTADDVAFFRSMRSTPETEAEWEELYSATHRNRFPELARPRRQVKIRVPQQRRAGAGS